MLALCQLLLAAKADVSAKNNAGQTPLHLACNSGQVRTGITHAFAACAGFPPPSHNTHTATPNSPCPPQLSIVQWLITKEADPNDADKAGDTPLHVAARAGFKGIVSALLASGAKQSSNRGGKTPANVALDKDIARILEKAAS